ncbi:MAG: VWA domain-containing protein [Candidatus Hydrogenedentales bacterium]
MLIPSFALATAVYALLYQLAYDVTLLRVEAVPTEFQEPLRVDLRDESELTPESRPSTEEPAPFERPESVRELLERELEALDAELALDTPAELPNLNDRIAAEQLPREHDLELDEERLSRVDARIIEIAEEDARQNIEVARRLVRPSPVRVVEEGELPSLREAGALDTPRTETLPPLAAEPQPVLEALEPGSGRPPVEDVFLFDEEPGETAQLPALPVEHEVALAPVRSDVQGDSRYEFMDDLVTIELTTYTPAPESEGFFELRIAPRTDRTLPILPKDVTFVVDASSSIVQRKLTLTERGLEQCLAMLRPEDRFNVVVFRDLPSFFRNDYVPATPENRAAALQFIDNLESRGETNVYDGIVPVIEQSIRSGLPGAVVVITDGRATRGVIDGRAIINGITDQNDRRIPIYAFGGGNTVNAELLALLAYRNKGSAEVTGLDQIATDLPRFFGRLQDPILANLASDYGRLNEQEVFPKELPDFYRGQEVRVYGRFHQTDGEFVMRLEGDAGERQKELVFKENLQDADTGGPEIARRWAFQKIYYLIGEITRLGERPELLAELRRLSREYNIQTAYSQ